MSIPPYYMVETWAGFPGSETPHIFQIVRASDCKKIEEFEDRDLAYKELELLNREGQS